MVALRAGSRYGRLLRRLAPRLLGPAILALLLVRVPGARALNAVAAARVLPFVGALALLLPLLIVRTHRWAILVRAQSLHLSAGEALAVYAFSVFAGTATPGRLGEFVKVVHLRQRGLSFGRAFATVFLDRFLDVVILVAMAAWGLAWFAGLRALPAVALAVVATGATILVLRGLASGEGNGRLRRIVGRVMPWRFASAAEAGLRDFGHAVAALAPSVVALAVMESVVGWLLNWSALALLASAIGIHVSFAYLAASASVCGLLAMLPVSILGLGTRDATLVVMLGRVGVAPADALAFSLMNLILLVAYGLICSLSLFSPTTRLEARTVRNEMGHRPLEPSS